MEGNSKTASDVLGSVFTPERDILSSLARLHSAPIFRLTDENIKLIFHYSMLPSFPSPPRHLASVCHRFRGLLLRDMYGEIQQSSRHLSSMLKFPALFELLPIYGHYTHRLDLRVQPYEEPNKFRRPDAPPRAEIRLSPILEGLARCAKHMMNLTHLSLRMYPYGPTRSATHTDTSPPSADTMATEDVKSLVSIIGTLSSRLESMELSGFSWADGATALNDGSVKFPNLRRLSLDLAGESYPQTVSSVSATFLDKCPVLVDIRLPASSWCPTKEWFQHLLGERKLEHIGIGFHDQGDAHVHHPQNQSPNDLDACYWASGLVDLFAASFASLRTVTISTESFPISSVQGFLANVTSITVHGLVGDDTAEKMLTPLAELPRLTTLRVVDCENVPHSFAVLLEPESALFPALKMLELGNMLTEADADDAEWPWGEEDDEEVDEERDTLVDSGEPYWKPETRRKLISDCGARMIDANFRWVWYGRD